MNKVIYCALATLVTGCASNSGVVPIGPATFMVSRQAATGFSGSGTLKADAFQEANQYCLSQNKKLQVVNTAEAQPPYIFGNFPKAEVQFKCLDANDQAPATSATENRVPSQKKTNDPVSWKSLGKSDDGEFFIDPNSIRKVDGLTYVWVKINFFKTQDKVQKYSSKGKIISAELENDVISCDSHTMAPVSIISKDANGGTIDIIDWDVKEWKFTSVPPGSTGDSVINAACSAQSGAPATGTAENSASAKLSSSGSGFIVSTSGYLLTNHHVANGCSNLKIRDSSKIEYDVTVIATDARNDLALLQTSTAVSLPAATFRANGSVEAGENVVALGYPLAGVLASEVNVSFGYVSATAGLADDTSKLQISAPVQPGNSGGPLLDQSGNLIGVVVAKLDAIKVAKAIGDIPQNINFAIKGEVAQVFLNAHKVKFKTATAAKKLENTDIANRGRAFTVLVECYK